MPLEQVTRFKYLGSWITEDAGCEVDIRARVGMSKAAFWQNKELMRRNIRFKTKLKLLNCYVFAVYPRSKDIVFCLSSLSFTPVSLSLYPSAIPFH